jgi:hypothetical protein
MEKKKRAIGLTVEDDDPRLVAFYPIADSAYDAFEETLRRVGLVPNDGLGRRWESVRRLSLYLGTLFGELMVATTQLAILEMPRAQYVLNRQLFEYFVRNQWFMANQDEALRQMDVLPRTVFKEMEKLPKLFDAATRAGITQNYQEWAKEHPELDVDVKEVGPTRMIRDILGVQQDPDLFWYYGHPSIIVHGKTHGIQEVLRDLGGGQLERVINSPGLDRVNELNRATGFTLEYAAFLAVNYGLDQATIGAISGRFGEALQSFGIEPETVTVRRSV